MIQGRFTTGFGPDSTADEVLRGIDLSGKNIIVTGGSSGIGIETARALATAGAAVTIGVRNPEAGGDVAAGINAELSQDRVRVRALDLTDLASVARFAEAWGHTPLHVLVNNAGVMATPLERTRAGWELQFATNHLGHFALASALHRALAAAQGARIVSLSSRGHLRSPVVFEDINFASRDYDPALAYGQSKTANVLFAVGATAQWGEDGITANAVHPGGVWTNLVRHIPADAREKLRIASEAAGELMTPQRGAATSVLVAVSPELDGIGGRYFEACNEAVRYDGGEQRVGVADYALDPASAERLWDISTTAIAPCQ